MRQRQRATDRLLHPGDGDIVARAFEAAKTYKTRPIEPTLLGDLRRLDAVTYANDADAGIIRLALAQLSTSHFETTDDPKDSEPALNAARSLTNYDTLPDWLSTYERGRTAYQVAKRLHDPALLEEAIHFYTEATRLVGLRSRSRWTLRRYLREATVMRRELVDEATQRTIARGGLAAARFDVPLDAFPATPAARRHRGFRRRLTKASAPFLCRPLGRTAEATFYWSGKLTPPHKRCGELDNRGRPLSGLLNTMEPDTGSLVNHLSLLLWLGTNDADSATDDLRLQAPELYEWAERVSRWAAVVTGRMPKLGFLVVTRYLYGELYLPSETRRLVLNADEPGITWELRTAGGADISRYELSYVLNRLVLHEVPVAIDMLQTAQYSFLDDQPRQAVIEAGTAAEAALSVLYDSYPTTDQREAPRQRSWTLGTLVSKAHRAGVLPAADTQDLLQTELVQPRNDAVHRGHATRAQAIAAIEAARRIVNHTFGTGTHDVVEIDQRMRQLGPLLRPRPTVRAGFTFPSDDQGPILN